MPELDRDTARDWIARWDRQQEAELPDREDRFTALIDAVEEGTGRPDPLVLDLGCGPGSLSVRLLARLPQATVVGIDADPVGLALGAAAYHGLPGLRLVDLDLRVPGWSGRLGLSRPADAAVSTTALHWLPEPDLRAMYAELAAVLRPGGLLLNGDHFLLDPKQSPVLARLDKALRQREDLRRFPGGHPESWHAWWDAAAADPGLSRYVAERQRRHVEADHHASSSTQLATHVDALGQAGFAEIGTLWQRGDNRVLCGVLPAAQPASLAAGLGVYLQLPQPPLDGGDPRGDGGEPVGQGLRAGPHPYHSRPQTAGQQLDDLLAGPVQVGAELHEHLRGDPVALADQAEQDVLGADVGMTELQRLAQRQLEHLLGPRGERDVPGRRVLAAADDLLDGLPDRNQADPHRLERPGRDALALMDQAEQDVLGADVVVVQQPGFFLRKDHDAPRPVGKSLEHLRSEGSWWVSGAGRTRC